MPESSPRRTFIKRALAAGAALSTQGVGASPAAGAAPASGPASGAAPDRAASPPPPTQASGLGPLDHVAVPMQNADAMIAFYRALGFTVRDGAQIVSVHFADQKINFHRPALWQRDTFTLRASAARPPCGDFCWVWNGTEEALRATLARGGRSRRTARRRTRRWERRRPEHLHAGPRREPARVHPLRVSGRAPGPIASCSATGQD